MENFSFKQIHKDTKTRARTGTITTPHGDIQTPAFVPVGTQATVKSLTPDELDTIGVQLYFVNTYHMYLRPGMDIIKKAGGLHSFMHWDKPLITDSGGFQVFSLARGRGAEVADENLDPSSISGTRVNRGDVKVKVKPDKILSAPRATNLVNISDDGVQFRSHWDGSKHEFTPESSMQWQWELGSDMHIAFDDCTPYPVSPSAAAASLERTHTWAVRSLKEHKKLASQHKGKPYQALYGSIQGSVFEDLRKQSAKFISSLDVDGIAIGGVSVGESKQDMTLVLDWVAPLLPENKPRHLLGVGEIDDIFMMIGHGIDTFDCVQSTRLARVGQLYTKGNKPTYTLDITKAKFEKDFTPIEKGCTCYACTNFTRAYIHHLFHVHELLGYRLASIHNLHFIHRLVDDIRNAIQTNHFLDLKRQWL